MTNRIISLDLYVKVSLDEDAIAQAIENKEYDGEKVNNEKDALYWMIAEKVRENDFKTRDWQLSPS